MLTDWTTGLSLFAGHPTKSGIEGRLLIFYYVFLVFNILLVVTISGSLFTAIRNMLEYPQRILSILATSIPTVSSFFVNYVMLLALSGPSGEMLQLGTLIIKPLRLRFFGTTPRLVKKFSQGPIFHTGIVKGERNEWILISDHRILCDRYRVSPALIHCDCWADILHSGKLNRL